MLRRKSFQTHTTLDSTCVTLNGDVHRKHLKQAPREGFIFIL